MLQIARILIALSLGTTSMATLASGQEAASGHTVQVNGIEMYYEEQGAGKPLVLLHGFFGCAQDWQPFAAELAEHYRLIIVDLRGHGHSRNPKNDFTHRQSASDVFSLLDALEIDRFSAMGISSGGMTLLHMATGQPKRVESMVLIGATSFFPEPARSMMRGEPGEPLPDDRERECAPRGDTQIRQLYAQFKGFHNSYDDMNFTGPYLSTISARTLIVHGDRDEFFPVEIPVDIYRSIPNSSLWIIPGGDHVPIYDPAVPFTATALRFLDGPGRK